MLRNFLKFSTTDHMTADAQRKEQSQKKKRKTVKKITESRLKNIALYYLQRFSATEHSLRQVLERRLKKAKYAHDPSDTDWEQWNTWVDKVVALCLDYGFVNDENYAKQKIRAMLAQGKSFRLIQMKLKEKGVATETTSALLDDLAEDTNLIAAQTFVRRKKLGPYRPPEKQADFYEKDLAKLARAGYSYQIAREVLKPSDQ